MRFAFSVCLIALGMTNVLAAQDPTKPVLRQGIPVQMPVASRAVALPAADEEDATVITVTVEGKLFLGVRPVDLNALANLPAPTVYLKADARAPLQQVLSVLNALSEHSLVLLTAPTAKPASGKITSPYGIRLTLEGGDH